LAVRTETAQFSHMRMRLFSLAAAAVLALWAAPAAHARPGPVLVELFTSQGCGACAKANSLVAEAGRGNDVLVLTYNVDYWDYLGWRDTFARPEFAHRQRAYAAAIGKRALTTPQIVVQGARGAEQVKPDTLTHLLAKPSPAPAARLRGEITASGGHRISIAASAAPVDAEVWLAEFEPGAMFVDVAKGENAGQRVAHYNVVRRLQRVGAWRGEATQWTTPRCVRACALIVQSRQGPVLAAWRSETAQLTAGN
jgi:hypothetical protein